MGNFRDVPLIEVSVERRSLPKHCRKNRRPITFTVKRARLEGGRTLIKILKQPKEGKRSQKRGNHSSNYIHHFPNPTPPPPEWTSVNHKSMFKSRYVILKDTYRLDVMHAGDTNLSVSQRTWTLTNHLWHHIVSTNPNPRLNPPNTIAWVHVPSSHSPLHVLTYFYTYR